MEWNNGAMEQFFQEESFSIICWHLLAFAGIFWPRPDTYHTSPRRYNNNSRLRHDPRAYLLARNHEDRPHIIIRHDRLVDEEENEHPKETKKQKNSTHAACLPSPRKTTLLRKQPGSTWGTQICWRRVCSEKHRPRSYSAMYITRSYTPYMEIWWLLYVFCG